MGFPGTGRGPNVNPDGGEELKGMSRVGYLRLRVCSNSGSSRAKGLAMGTGALGGVKLADRLPSRVFDVGHMPEREAFELLRTAGITENITYMNVCSEWFHEFLTSKDGIGGHDASIDS